MIQTSNGQCLFVDKLSGDFRANLTPVQVAACDDTDGQKWDIITGGQHNDQAGTILIVSTLVSDFPTHLQIFADHIACRPRRVSTLILAALLETKFFFFHVVAVPTVVRQQVSIS